ncbi:MAG: hypothetical protein LBC61_07095 [Candidatus Peribacteria bacterium]|jgi:hypothetical protein|nr:hypothetical protein [Candidatus Peribacteria bacterium]
MAINNPYVDLNITNFEFISYSRIPCKTRKDVQDLNAIELGELKGLKNLHKSKVTDVLYLYPDPDED